MDWNILGVAVATTLGAERRAHVSGSVGHTTLDSIVGYRWELTARATYDVYRRGDTALYAAARARLVTIDPEPELPRDDFLDWAFEGGVRLRRGGAAFEGFAAYERRNDVLLLAPSARDRGLFGIRIGLTHREAVSRPQGSASSTPARSASWASAALRTSMCRLSRTRLSR